jgi:hypothetical protein
MQKWFWFYYNVINFDLMHLFKKTCTLLIVSWNLIGRDNDHSLDTDTDIQQCKAKFYL